MLVRECIISKAVDIVIQIMQARQFSASFVEIKYLVP
jgi:hypothetical protein